MSSRESIQVHVEAYRRMPCLRHNGTYLCKKGLKGPLFYKHDVL